MRRHHRETPLAAGAGAIDLNEGTGNTLNIEQASAAAVAAANGIPAGNVTPDAGVSFGVTCATPPAEAQPLMLEVSSGLEAPLMQRGPVAVSTEPPCVVAAAPAVAKTKEEQVRVPSVVGADPASIGTLTDAQLVETVKEAIARWEATGLTAQQLAWLHALRFEVADLPGIHLGEAHSDRIRVDNDAGGNGWFIDAPVEGAASGHIDLLTTIMHEMGHAIGLPDSYTEQDRDSLMYGFLAKGQRRLPQKGQADGAIPGSVAGTHFLGGPVNIGTLPPNKSVTIKFSVTVGPITTVNPQNISSQGTVTADGGISVQTDDTDQPGGAANPTITLLGIAPTFTSANATTFTVGTMGTFNVTANGAPPPTFTTSGLPSGVTLTPAGVLSGTPAAGTGGTYPITITATNGIAPNATQSFTLTVNQAPAITSANNTTFTVGSAGTFTVTTTGFPTGPTLVLSQTGTLPSGVTFTDNGNGTATLAGTPAAATGGSYPITITANNGVAPNANQSFTLTVNQAPAITSANATTFTVGSAGTFSVTTTGFPAPSLARGGVALPTGVTFTDNGNGTGTLAGTPAAGTGGTYAITFTATNSTGATPAQTFTLTVNQAPAITSTNATTFTVGAAGSFNVTTTGFPAPLIARGGVPCPLA